MKMTALTLLALTLSFGAAHADSTAPTHFGLTPIPASVTAPAHQPGGVQSIPALSIAPLPGTAANSPLPSSPNDFAQLSTTNHSMPINSGMVLALIAVFVVALRLMGLQHARVMADHERHSYQGKAAMFHSLQKERTR